ncbi:MAG: dihydrodipicolinate synthase family protein [Acidobacteria bacterium]|nr:dihydrodipicolinate synthase family protein [Acidobacteriota bacterium]
MESPPFHIHGIVPIIPTPFNHEEQIAWDELRNLIDFACAAGVSAICLPAYASEFYKLSEDERSRLVVEAVGDAKGRVPVIGQVNYPSAAHAAKMAVHLQKCGASAICVAAPRLFPLSDRDLLRYFDRILKSIDVPLIVQDVNPVGQSLSVRFIGDLHREHAHFRYAKLEEPLMAAKVEDILEETGGAVGVLEGWGGMYMMELTPAGICGVMPGLGLADVLGRVFRLLVQGRREEACEIFQVVLPQIVFSLQNMEFYHHAEKRLLRARGILGSAKVRESSMDLREREKEHIDFLNGRVLALLDRLELPRSPAVPAGICS